MRQVTELLLVALVVLAPARDAGGTIVALVITPTAAHLSEVQIIASKATGVFARVEVAGAAGPGRGAADSD